MATENILMYCVKKGGDRQELHEAVREHSVAVTKRIKLEGGENDLLERILADKRFGLTKEELVNIVKVQDFIGCAPQQTEEFCENSVKSVLGENRGLLGLNVVINV